MIQEVPDRRSKTILGIDDSWEMQAIVNNTLGDLEKCQSAGGNGFIMKPVSARELLRHVNYWAVRHVEPQRT
jgi:hypothetical protein